MNEDKVLAVLSEICNLIRAGSYTSIKALLEATLPDTKSRTAYQMMDGTATAEQIRVACKMSPNVLVALGQRCTSMGLMELREDKKRVRLFDLADFGLLDARPEPVAKTNGK
jgi:hypothetical protein